MAFCRRLALIRRRLARPVQSVCVGGIGRPEVECLVTSKAPESCPTVRACGEQGTAASVMEKTILTYSTNKASVQSPKACTRSAPRQTARTPARSLSRFLRNLVQTVTDELISG